MIALMLAYSMGLRERVELGRVYQDFAVDAVPHLPVGTPVTLVGHRQGAMQSYLRRGLAKANSFEEAWQEAPRGSTIILCAKRDDVVFPDPQTVPAVLCDGEVMIALYLATK